MNYLIFYSKIFKSFNTILLLGAIAMTMTSCTKDVDGNNYSVVEIKNEKWPDSVKTLLQKSKKNNTIVQIQRSNIYSRYFFDMDYRCEIYISDKDTLNISFNNYNGYYGNGNVVKIFNNNFQVHSIDPTVSKVLKFEKYKLLNEQLVLDRKNYKRGDSISGYFNFETSFDSLKSKRMYGYFKTKIK